MASGREVLISDLPPELNDRSVATRVSNNGSWQQLLKQWCYSELTQGKSGVLDQAIPEFEKTMIESALAHTGGQKKEAAILLGWGRNTLTRKLKELKLGATD